MEKLIVIEEKRNYQYEDIKSLVEDFINKNYFHMSEKEKKSELEKKTKINAMLLNVKIVKYGRTTFKIDKNAFILYDEITFILSMLKFNRIVLLERIDANIFGKYIDKESIKNNYIIVNNFADDIMEKYLKNIYQNNKNVLEENNG